MDMLYQYIPYLGLTALNRAWGISKEFFNACAGYNLYDSFIFHGSFVYYGQFHNTISENGTHTHTRILCSLN